MTQEPRTGTIDRGDGVRLAYAFTPGSLPALVFLPGFMSDMTGDKALATEDFARSHGHACLRLDYSGHGASSGWFENGCISIWSGDALHVIHEVLPTGGLILVGSSMGGWIALNLALTLQLRVAALVGIAAAPDFTARLMWAHFSPAQRERLLQDGVLRLPSAYGGEQIITRRLIEDGREHLLLEAPIAINCPVRLLHGQCDPDVPWQTALTLAERLESRDVRVTLIKDGAHRLSRPQDIALLRDTLAEVYSEFRQRNGVVSAATV